MKNVDSIGKLNKVCNSNPQESRLRGRPKSRGRNCVQTDD
jgi:hypothetical protein